MRHSMYLINPLADFPTYFNAENYVARGCGRATQMSDLAIPTLAALCPPDFDVRLCDQNISDVDYDIDVDYIGITGKITQFGHMVTIAREFRRRGRVVVIGGPYASLSPEMVRPHCDVLVTGEIEEIAGEVFADLRAGTWKAHYAGGQPGLASSPVPRWDLYPNDRALMGTLQTSRGCPFECEFCDVIQYAGRRQRHKNAPQVLRELDELYRCGYRNVFLADDNLTVYRSRAKELLAALRDWNRRHDAGKVSFLSQVSIDAARDEELLTLCAEAGLTTVFIGIETPNVASLKETKKRQNLHGNILDQVHRFFAHGIHVVGGMIVGFDSDDRSIFQRQLDFAMASGIPIFSLGALVAPAATPLHARLEKAGRLRPNDAEVAAVPWKTNIVHPTMSEEELRAGMKWLANHLYDPELFTERLLVFVDKLGVRRDPQWNHAGPARPLRSVEVDTFEIVSEFRRLGPVEHRMWRRIRDAIAAKPPAGTFVLAALLQYMQIRYMYEVGQFWDVEVVNPGRGQKSADRGAPGVESTLIGIESIATTRVRG
jgi:radical SAM superfamily enzyme YgiQ (UPF0313 family)